MRRREFLGGVTGGAALLAGCQAEPVTPPRNSRRLITYSNHWVILIASDSILPFSRLFDRSTPAGGR